MRRFGKSKSIGFRSDPTKLGEAVFHEPFRKLLDKNGHNPDRQMADIV
jgi:hypothetical protein